jgi:hypothetical protein
MRVLCGARCSANEGVMASSKAQMAEAQALVKTLEGESRDVEARKAKLLAEAAAQVKHARKCLAECEAATAKALKRAEAASSEAGTAKEEFAMVQTQLALAKVRWRPGGTQAGRIARLGLMLATDGGARGRGAGGRAGGQV